MADLRTYRITAANGSTMTVQLSPETAKRDYPNAVELKVDAPEIKGAPKPTRRKSSGDD